MPRWEPDARIRLQQAALALYHEQGFDATTVEQIAEHAGLTKRFFFRHFSDKREVLFAWGEDLEGMFVRAVRSAPPSVGALDAVALGLAALAAKFDAQGEPATRLFRIVRASPELWERQLIKFASMAEAVARALRARGVRDPAAILAAESGITALRVASDRWIRGTSKRSLRDLIADALAELRALAYLEPSPLAGTKKRVSAKGRKPRN